LSTLRTIHADITGELGKYGIKLPTANDGVAVNIGEEYRSDHEQFEPDAAEQGGLLTNFSAVVPIADSVSVNEQFIELRAPLIQDHPGVKELVADAGFRRSDYSVSGGVNTGKFDVQYAPVSGLRFRGSYQRAIRAPTIAELYTPQSIQLIQLGTDPCAPVGATPATATLAQCMKTGVTAAQYGNGGSTNIIPQTTLGDVSVLTGGGPKLTPERSDSYTFGVTLNSSMVPGLTGSIDYYRIMVKDEVGTIPASLILSQCLTTGDPTYCSQIVRNPNTGGLTASSIASGGYIAQNNINVGAALVSGIDLQFGYKLSLPQHWGSVAFSVNGSYLQHVDSTPLPGQHTYDCAGLFGATCQTVNPRWHHVVRTSWITPWNASASLTWRYIGKVGEDNDDNDPSLHFATYGAYDYFNATIPAYSYLDLAGSWTIPHTTVELRAGINNLLDKDPPLINSTIAPFGQNTYPTYDIFGRQVFIAFTAKFR
jgi:outer membrane receptor protein involved in Fe transport